MPLSVDKLHELQSEALADDVPLDLAVMQHWTEAEARSFFESGGTSCPPPRLLHGMAMLLEEAGASHLFEKLQDEDLSSFAYRYCSAVDVMEGRSALMRRLKRCGVSAVTDRQRIINAFMRSWREGRIPMPSSSRLEPLDPPITLWERCITAIGVLRQALAARSYSVELINGHSSEEIALEIATALDDLPSMADDLTIAQRLSLSPRLLADALEAMGWHLDEVSLLLEGCGLLAHSKDTSAKAAIRCAKATIHSAKAAIHGDRDGGNGGGGDAGGDAGGGSGVGGVGGVGGGGNGGSGSCGGGGRCCGGGGGASGGGGDGCPRRPRLGQRVAFWTYSMCERGTEVAVYDYADFGERCLGLTSYVLYPGLEGYHGARDKFTRRFGAKRVIGLQVDEVGAFLENKCIGHVYIIKEGTPYVPDVRLLPRSVRSLVHCVFHANTPHGDVYAKISPCVRGFAPVVPHIVRSCDPHGPNLRVELGLPADATVFGRHGGWDTFDIQFASRAVIEVARARADSIYFVFLNTAPFTTPRRNIIHLPRTSDVGRISSFIRTCDAMLHARSGGETFGLACAEFSAHNRPVLASAAHDDDGHGSMHLDTLRGHNLERFFYRDHASLVHQMLHFDRNQRGDFNAHRAFEPAAVMSQFEHVFLRAGPPPTHDEVKEAHESGVSVR
jgi:hypothetical protein